MTESVIPSCPHCAAPLSPGALFCPTCRRLVYHARFLELVNEARRQEAIDPILAAGTWRQSLALLPPETMEARQIAARAAALGAGLFQPQQRPIPLNYAQPERKPETWASVLLKTGGSMALSMAIYSQNYGWQFAVGFVLLILIHELGHTIANWYYGIKQSPPIFLPYVGALIMLRQNPPDAKAEAVIGIAGPIAGTFGALACYAMYLYTGNPILLVLTHNALFLNLFNLIPIWPLDGGRVAAGITPALWIPGVALFAWVMLQLGGYRSIGTILIALWVFQGTLPRIREVIFRGGMKNAYYRIGAPARLAIIFSYIMLAGLLSVITWTPAALWFSLMR